LNNELTRGFSANHRKSWGVQGLTCWFPGSALLSRLSDWTINVVDPILVSGTQAVSDAPTAAQNANIFRLSTCLFRRSWAYSHWQNLLATVDHVGLPQMVVLVS